jgi:hypothetical protein
VATVKVTVIITIPFVVSLLRVGLILFLVVVLRNANNSTRNQASEGCSDSLLDCPHHRGGGEWHRPGATSHARVTSKTFRRDLVLPTFCSIVSFLVTLLFSYHSPDGEAGGPLAGSEQCR